MMKQVIFAGFVICSSVISSCNKGGCIDESKIAPDAPCNKILAPVCGCDGKTYGNECQAKNAGVIFWKQGKCN